LLVGPAIEVPVRAMFACPTLQTYEQCGLALPCCRHSPGRPRHIGRLAILFDTRPTLCSDKWCDPPIRTASQILRMAAAPAALSVMGRMTGMAGDPSLVQAFPARIGVSC